MALTRTQKENQIVSRLKEDIVNAQIEPFPDNADKFKPLKPRCILVGYEGKLRLENDTGRGTLQGNVERYRLLFMYQNRRTHQGLLNDLELAEYVLSGYKIDGTFLSLADESFDGYDDNKSRWIYSMTFEHVERRDSRDYDLSYLLDGEGNYQKNVDGEFLT